MKKLMLIFCLLFIVSLANGQSSAQYIENQILVQLEQGVNNKNLGLYDLKQSADLVPKELLSKHMNIWLMEFDEKKMSVNELIKQLRLKPNVVNAQVNHVLTNRNVAPNDTEYSKQWQYNNPGVVAGDIGAEKAWEYTTGGVTEQGDTIVIAVIDDGLDEMVDHTDFEDNLWINRHEIPNNEKDDDGNGYIDDVYGWNTQKYNDNIKVDGSHGTPVAGICGAKGNNNKGVTGVNWNVKLMIIVGGSGVGGGEAGVIQAYSYALENRKLYNKTKGKKGAFVVATNSSWGVDRGKADQAPLWCAFYDTLGHHGILSAGATINFGIDVDVEGDLPTQCPSDYLIAVTNQGPDGKKVKFAGYGAKSIDLGAPGHLTWTTSEFNRYEEFGGTSGATPHVAGSIALLFSAPCRKFAIEAIEKPAETALKVREYIFDGTVGNSTMKNITTTEGSLNVHNAMLELLKDMDCDVSLKGNKGVIEVLAFPNPVKEIVNVKVMDNGKTHYKLNVFDSLGKEIIIEYSNVSNNLFELKMDDLTQGVYFLKITSDRGSHIQKLIKK